MNKKIDVKPKTTFSRKIQSSNRYKELNNLKNEYKIIEQTKLNMMSVLSYLIKYGANLQTGLRKSMKDTWNMYKRYHENIKSLSTFRDTIYKLKEANLISIIKKGKINIYFAKCRIKLRNHIVDCGLVYFDIV